MNEKLRSIYYLTCAHFYGSMSVLVALLALVLPGSLIVAVSLWSSP